MTDSRIVYDAWCPACGEMYGIYNGRLCPKCGAAEVVYTEDYRDNIDLINKGRARRGKGSSQPA